MHDQRYAEQNIQIKYHTAILTSIYLTAVGLDMIGPTLQKRQQAQRYAFGLDGAGMMRLPYAERVRTRLLANQPKAATADKPRTIPITIPAMAPPVNPEEAR